MKKICIAVDKSNDGFDLLSFTKQFQGDIIFKVGLEYFTKFGGRGIEGVPSDIFLDLKFFDIPNTVYHAVKNVCCIKNVKLLTIHAAGGEEMIKSAVMARDECKSEAKIICVTKLTSQKASVSDVLLLTEAAIDAGADGIVCSAQEASFVRQRYGEDLIVVTPGIRPSWYNVSDDQVRTRTPQEAFSAGSNVVVIGRPITASSEPSSALEKIFDEIK